MPAVSKAVELKFIKAWETVQDIALAVRKTTKADKIPTKVEALTRKKTTRAVIPTATKGTLKITSFSFKTATILEIIR